jgi:hypothetical protein
MNDEMEKMWKEAAVAQFKEIGVLWHSGRMDCAVPDSKQAPLRNHPEAFPPEATFLVRRDRGQHIRRR